MITQKTAADIWSAYREIEAAEKLLKDMSEAGNTWGAPDKFAPTLKDAFGRVQNLQLGIPMGESGHRLYSVSPALAETCIRAHIANKRAELADANERARIELQADGVLK